MINPSDFIITTTNVKLSGERQRVHLERLVRLYSLYPL